MKHVLSRSQQKTIINSMAVNEDGVLATAGMLVVFLTDLAVTVENIYIINISKLTCLFFSEGDNGSLWFWDWKSGHNFQQAQTIVQPGWFWLIFTCKLSFTWDVLLVSWRFSLFRSGSLDSEACIYALSYDLSGSRLVTCEADKTIKMWKEDASATLETHPINFKPPKEFRRY